MPGGHATSAAGTDQSFGAAPSDRSTDAAGGRNGGYLKSFVDNAWWAGISAA
jgi:hypothetical protein